MAGTTQRRPRSRKLTVCCKVFFVLMLSAWLVDVCTTTELPDELTNSDIFEQMQKHFCKSSGKVEHQSSTCRKDGDPGSLCHTICSQRNSMKCWEDGIRNTCLNNQNLLCGYNNAVVCQYRDNRGICVYGTADTFCICEQQMISNNRCRKKVSVETILLAVILSTILLLAVGGVILYLWKKRKLPTMNKQTSRRRNSNTRGNNVTQRPVPPVPGSDIEYSYAHDTRPVNTGIKNYSDDDDDTYYTVGEEGEGCVRYVTNGPGQATSAKKTDAASTEDANDHAYFALEETESKLEDDVVRREDGGTAEVTDSKTGVHSKKRDNDDYTPLIPTADPTSQAERSGEEVTVMLPSPKNIEIASSPTGVLYKEGGDVVDTYTKLNQSALPKPRDENSRYKVAEVHSSPNESDAPSSQTGDDAKEGDDNNYTPLVPTVKPKSGDVAAGVLFKEGDDGDYTPLVSTVDSKSPNEHSGDEVEVVSPSSDGNAVPSTDDSSTDALSKRDDSTYSLLISKDHSGYEVAEVPATPTKSDVSSSQTGDVSKEGDDNNYTPLVLAVEPKSRNNLSGYEVAEKLPSAADSDDQRQYDHLKRKTDNTLNECANSTMDDDYQCLVKDN